MPFLLEVPKTTASPYVLIDEGNNYMKIEGRSYDENVVEFFEQINKWLDAYLNTDFGTFVFDCELDYFNSASVKVLLSMIDKMDMLPSENNKVILNWNTTSDNDIVIEFGEDMIGEGVKCLKFCLNIKEDDD
jgi:hypothetical protein